MEKDKGKEIEIEDSFLASAFLVQTDIIKEVLPFLKSEHPPRVAFRIKGNIQSALSRIYADEPCGLMAFIKAAKQLRNSIFILKSMSSTQGPNKKETMES